MHVLIGWELGSNRGHIERIALHRTRLQAEGHRVTVIERGKGAPAWGTGLNISPHSFGDVLYRIGGAVPGLFHSVVAGWERILADLRPDAVLADFAPGLLTAARGRIPTVAYGNGFDIPPSDIETFPSLSGVPPRDEGELRRIMNVDRVPSIFTADRVVLAALPVFEPYQRDTIMPASRAPMRGDGDEIFVYWPGRLPKGLWEALRPFKPRAFIPELGIGEAVEWPEIARRSRMVVSHGGCGFVTQALLSGLPQVILPPDLEKHVYARAVQRLGLGRQVTAISNMAHIIKSVYEMPDLCVEQFHTPSSITVVDAIVKALDEVSSI